MIDKKVLSPFQKFVNIESFSGILLFCAAVVALVWVNSPFSQAYESLWQYQVGLSTKDFELSKPLILWINDGLMAVFFFLIGLEIKRELLIGELNSLKKAAFPFFGAVGGIVVPVVLFFVLNRNPETANGWGIPMATDIAFSLAILKLLGNRVPLSLKIFLTAFAIVDDLVAVLVIAVFYSSNIKWALIIYAFILLLVLFFLAFRGRYIKYLTVLFGIIIWFLFLKAGLHPTIAGVLLAFTIPIRRRIDIKTYTDNLAGIVKNINNSADPGSPLLSKDQIEQIDNLEDWTNKVQSPLQHLEHRLHNWVAYLIIPVFALSNAGVSFSRDMNLDTSLIVSIAISLIIGKCVGVSLFSFLGVKLKLAEFPEDTNFWQLIGVACLAGVGFTMSIFIANLAFAEHPIFMDSAKVGVFCGSLFAGVIGFAILKLSSKVTQ